MIKMNEEIYKDIGAIKNQWVETKGEYLDMALNVIDNLKIKNKQLKEELKIKQDDFKCANEEINQLKEVIEEAREIIEMTKIKRYLLEQEEKVLEILDKVKNV